MRIPHGFALMILLLAGCSSPTDSPSVGSLAISVTGLVDAPAAIAVAGPGGYSGVVTATTTLSSLQPGTYTLTAASVAAPSATYAVLTAVQSLAVVASSTPVTTKVEYRECPARSNRILIEASHDGGVWWFPQTGSFVAGAPHQGQALADYLRGKGYVVDELGRGAAVDKALLAGYRNIIRAGNYGPYTSEELQAYAYLASCPATLLVMGEFLRPGERDRLADQVGAPMSGSYAGTISTFAAHPITAGVPSVSFMTGSAVETNLAKSVQVLGWLATGEPVMGIVVDHRAKIFFLGDLNGLEGVPQPLVDNLIAWGF